MKFGHLILRKVIKFIATSCQIFRLKYIKFNFGPRPAGELTTLPRPSSWI